MGIKGLTTFINDNYKWKAANLKGKNLIIDGLNICCILYNNKLSCNFGGEYHQFDKLIEKFFKKIKKQKCEPIVIFYGVQMENRLDEIRQRRLRSFEVMKSMQTGSTVDRHFHEIKLNMLKPVCMDVLRRLDIEFYVASTEPHKAIAALANKKGCPVLSSDSKYFIFDLKHGLIHFDRYLEKKESLFIRDQFMKQFSLKGDQMLIIPGEFETKYFDKFSFFKLTRSYENFRKYYEKYDVTLHDKYEDMKRFYCDDLKVPFGISDGGGPLDPRLDAIPGGIIRKFRDGLYPPFFVAIYHDKHFLLPTMVEVITEDSAWLISREIRQYIYGLLRIPADTPVKEIIRENKVPELTEENVFPKLIVSQQLIVESVLLPNEISSSEDFKQLDAKWKLPIAATSYWYLHLDVPMEFVKSLVLSFLTCSDVIPSPGMVPRPDTIDPRPDSKYQQALHAFAKWQCVYHDAIALNYVTYEPFPTTSIASLYSGQVAMSYALGYRSADEAASAEGKLYNSFLRLATKGKERQIVTSSRREYQQRLSHLTGKRSFDIRPQQAHRELPCQ